MTPLLPPHLALWGSPLYNELYLGLCRALAAPWLSGIESSAARRSLQPPYTEQSRWLLLDSDEGGSIGAGSLAELRRTVCGTGAQNGISSSRSS
jgi:hypothetical protein